VGGGGGALVTANCSALLDPTVGAGLRTVTLTEPACATSLANMTAESCVAATKVVARSAPAHCTWAPCTKPVPVTVRVNAWLPVRVADGLSAVNAGAAFRIVNVSDADVPPPGAGLTTRTCAIPAEAKSPAAMAALTALLLTTVVGRVAPFHCTVVPGTKPEPFTVRSIAGLPASASAGTSERTAGAEFWIANGTAVEVPPPGAGLTTVN